MNEAPFDGGQKLFDANKKIEASHERRLEKCSEVESGRERPA